MNNTTQNIAFFDIDHTILNINSGETLIKHAYYKGLMSTFCLKKAAYTRLQYKYSLSNTHKIINKLGSWLKGLSEEEFNKIVKEIIHKDILPNIRPDIIKRINRLKNQRTEIYSLY